jgi:hypothetical protein
MYHILAAKSYNQTGELTILDGIYNRANLYTKIVSYQMKLSCDNLECARYVSMISSIILIILIIITSNYLYNSETAIVAGLLAGTCPALVEYAHTLRFYSMHALSFYIFAICTFILISKTDMIVRNKKYIMLVIYIITSLISLIISYHLQITTIIGLLGIGIGLVLINIIKIKIFIKYMYHEHKKSFIVLLVLAILTITIVLYNMYPWIIQSYMTFNTSPPWAWVQSKNYLYYHNILSDWYPALWTLSPFFCVLSFSRWPKKTIFFLTIFAISFIIFSIAPQKDSRYIVYAIPFIIIPLSAGISVITKITLTHINNSKTSKNNYKYVYIITIIGLITSIFLFIATQPVMNQAYSVIIKNSHPSIFTNYQQSKKYDWGKVANILKNKNDDSYVLITSSSGKAAYYFGDYSFSLNYSEIHHTDTKKEFGLDPRTGRRVITSAESIEKILKKCKKCIIIAEKHHIDGINIPNETVKYIIKYGNKIETNVNNISVWKIDKSITVNKKENNQVKNNLNIECIKIKI